MEYIGIDVHKNESQVCLVTGDGEILERRIATRRDKFAELLGVRSPARIVIEASTESEWVARCLEELGHEVIVADPNFSPMYATRSRRVKTDRRDAQALMDACRLGAFRAAHRTSEPQRDVRARLTARDALVRTRTRLILVLRALYRREGLRIRSGEAATFATRLREVDAPANLLELRDQLLRVLLAVNEELSRLDVRFRDLAQSDATVRRLTTIPGVGPITAAAFVSILDSVDRFERAHEVEAYLGLVPSEASSGERRQRGGVTKAGNGRMRWLLVESAWIIMRSRREDTRHLREWAERITLRRGRKIAALALARRIAGILFAMWRDGTSYAAPSHRTTRAVAV